MANLALRFLLEVAGFIGIGVVAFGRLNGLDGPLRWVFAVGASLALIVTWWAVPAPRTENGLSQTQKDLIGTTLLLMVAAAVYLAGEPKLAIIYAVVVILNAGLLLAFGPDVRRTFKPD
jgi:hypothetical protein